MSVYSAEWTTDPPFSLFGSASRSSEPCLRSRHSLLLHLFLGSVALPCSLFS